MRRFPTLVAIIVLVFGNLGAAAAPTMDAVRIFFQPIQSFPDHRST